MDTFAGDGKSCVTAKEVNKTFRTSRAGMRGISSNSADHTTVMENENKTVTFETLLDRTQRITPQ